MTKEIIGITLQSKIYDTTKMDSWTEEQWREFVGEEKDYIGWQFILLDDSDLYFELKKLSFSELVEEIYIDFAIQNKHDANIMIKFGQGKIGNHAFDLSLEKALYLEMFSDVINLRKIFYSSYEDDWVEIIFEITILDVETNSIIREIEFQITREFIHVF